MKRHFFSIRLNPGEGVLSLGIEYSLEKVPQPNLWFYPVEIPTGYLDRFKFELDGSTPEDLLHNSLGWHIFSPRVVEVLRTSRNSNDLRLVPLPELLTEQDKRLRGYCVLGIKREIKCVDVDRSDILWTNILGKQYISSFRWCAINESLISENMDVFLLQEYPVMAIISAEMAMKIAELRPSGFIYEKIETLC